MSGLLAALQTKGGIAAILGGVIVILVGLLRRRIAAGTVAKADTKLDADTKRIKGLDNQGVADDLAKRSR